jgi:hypothetical protein
MELYGQLQASVTLHLGKEPPPRVSLDRRKEETKRDGTKERKKEMRDYRV